LQTRPSCALYLSPAHKPWPLLVLLPGLSKTSGQFLNFLQSTNFVHTESGWRSRSDAGSRERTGYQALWSQVGEIPFRLVEQMWLFAVSINTKCPTLADPAQAQLYAAQSRRWRAPLPKPTKAARSSPMRKGVLPPWRNPGSFPHGVERSVKNNTKGTTNAKH
jgi:hypothetical protein